MISSAAFVVGGTAPHSSPQSHGVGITVSREDLRMGFINACLQRALFMERAKPNKKRANASSVAGQQPDGRDAPPAAL